MKYNNYPQQYNNMQYQNQNQNMQQQINPYQEKLRVAYNLFTAGVNDYKNFSLELALLKFQQADKVIKEAYPHIQSNPKLKETTDKFQRQVTQYLTSTEKQIAHRFDYKPTCGYADIDYEKNMKREIAQMIQDADSSNNKKYT